MTGQIIIAALALAAVLAVGVWVVADHYAQASAPGAGDGVAVLEAVLDGPPVTGQIWACGRAQVPPRSHRAGTVYIHRRRR